MRWLRELAARFQGNEQKIRVLAVLSDPGDRAALDGIAAHERWDLKLASSCDSAVEVLRYHPVSVILCDRDLKGCDWREAIKVLGESSPASRMILTSPKTDDKLWLEVIERGGYDVITKPFYEHRVVQAVTMAWNELRK